MNEQKKIFSNNNSFLNNGDIIFVEAHDRIIAGCEKVVLNTAKKYGFNINKKGQFIVLEK